MAHISACRGPQHGSTGQYFPPLPHRFGHVRGSDAEIGAFDTELGHVSIFGDEFTAESVAADTTVAFEEFSAQVNESVSSNEYVHHMQQDEE